MGIILLGVMSVLLCISYSKEYALRFLEITVLDMNGLGVWCCGVGLMFYVTKHGKEIAQDLNMVFTPSKAIFDVISKIEKSTLHKKGIFITGPVTLVGVFLTFHYTAPHYGASAFIIYAAVVFIYYTASFLLYHFCMIIAAFNSVYRDAEGLQIEKDVNGFNLENVSSYLSLTSTVGLLAIYFGFRGTVTAGFSYSNPIWEYFLVTPLILFLPGTFFYNFYPRHVLKKIFQYKIFSKLLSITTKDDLDIKNSILEIKEASLLNSQIAPFADYKNIPSYLVGIMFLLNVVFAHDPAIKEFIAKFLQID
ncbi:hypothetical protein [Maridesulfovibrio salexigens]|uniref:hypothetical protein n=1 Tax=Maridesulfovibrio salexigens TaxID=880 RepID=UPI0012ED7621|nr:hypothetical protein [Maridesulfovibrio salexigens]